MKVAPPKKFSVIGFISKWMKETSDVMIVLLFSIQILFCDALTKYGVTAAIWLIYWVWRRDNWLIAIFNLILFYFIGNDYFELSTRCFLFYCTSNIAFHMNKNTLAAIYDLSLVFVFVFFGGYGFRQNRDVSVAVGASLFFPLFFGDIQNDLLNVHFYAPFAAAGVLFYYEDFVHAFPFILSFLTTICHWPDEYPTFKNTKYSRNVITVFVIILGAFYYEYRQGIILESYNITYDSLHMAPVLISLFISYLGFVFWNKEYSKQYRYGYSQLHHIVSLCTVIIMIFGEILHLMETLYKLWYLSPVGSDRSSVVLAIVIFVLAFSLYIIYDWKDLDNIHQIIFTNIHILILQHAAVLISPFMILYFDFFRFEFISRLLVAFYSLYISYPLLKSAISLLLYHPGELYNEIYQIIDEFCHVKHIDIRYGSEKWVVEAKCQLKDRRMRVGVPSKFFHEKFKKLNIDATIEIIDAPPPPKPNY